MIAARARLAPLALLVGCGGASPAARTASAPAPVAPRVGVEVRAETARPAVALVVREGDPRPAVALAVATDGGPVASVALAALTRARLSGAGFPDVDVSANRDGYRARAFVADAARARALVAAFARAMSVPIGEADAPIVARALAALGALPLDGSAREAVASCTGELGLPPGERPPDATTPAGRATVEGMRARSHVTGRVAIGVAGPRTVGDAVAAAVREATSFVTGAPASSEWPARGAAAADASSGPNTRLTVAARVADPVSAVLAAERLGAADGALAPRLAALAPGWRARAIDASARLRGGCIAVDAEPTSGAATPWESSPQAAALIAEEIARVVGLAAVDASADGAALRPAAAAADARDAAALAAWWSLARAEPGATTRVAAAIALPARSVREDDAGRLLAGIGQKLAAALASPASLPAATVEQRHAVERGQGELWMLAASPCGTSLEQESDAGTTALAAIAAVALRERDGDGVSLAPWITPDGVGVIAHAPPRAGEGAAAHAQRVADAAGRALGAPSVDATFPVARASLLARLGEGASPDGPAMGALAAALAPGRPSAVSPLGAWSTVSRASAASASMRWNALAAGPIRVAVLAPEDAAQAAAAAAAVARWLPRGAPRACPAADAPAPARAGSLAVELAGGARAQALVAVPVPPRGAAERGFAEVTALALGPWLAAALSPEPSATATARLVGGEQRAALVVDVRAPDDRVEPAIALVRALFARIAAGGAEQQDLDRAAARAAAARLEARVTQAGRVVALWQGRADAAPPESLGAWRAWHATALAEASTIVVVGRAKR